MLEYTSIEIFHSNEQTKMTTRIELKILVQLLTIYVGLKFVRK